ncbi:sterol O-acyltransferase 1-like isoform X2 [Anneissia japonica]|nr:sterol O-acyltransferase 1-like isoform X2 [Anneissia japonica]
MSKLKLQTTIQRIRSDLVQDIDQLLQEKLEAILNETDDVKTHQETDSPQNQFPRRDHLAVKEFKARESVLTDLFGNRHIQTIYNIFVALMIVFSLNTLVYDLLVHGRIMVNFNIISWAFGNLPGVLWIWGIMQLYTMVIVFSLFQYWANERHKTMHLPDVVWLCFYILLQLVFFIFPIHAVVHNQLPPASSIIILAEQARLMMKSHAFVRENIPRAIAWKPHSDADLTRRAALQQLTEETTLRNGEIKPELAEIEGPCPDFSKYLYFLFAPTLVYREHYPRTSKIHWNVVRTNLVQVLACLFFTYYVFVRFCVPVFKNFGKEDLTFHNLTLASFSVMLPATLVLVLGFFAILHSWLNAFAEMMRFADRQFYKDWWNVKTYSNYYRTWNIVVHDWLFTYIYRDLQILGFSKFASMMAVFVISAFIHEFILAVSLNFFYPVLFFMFGGVGVSFTFLPAKSSSQPWNVFVWVSLFIGSGVLMCLYSQEWFARINCPRTIESYWDFFIPRSWTCNISSALGDSQ